MSKGVEFQQQVQELRELGFAVDRVTGGDIHQVVVSRLEPAEAIRFLERRAELRRRMKQALNKIPA